MKNLFKMFVSVFIMASITILFGCKKDDEMPLVEIPTLTTDAVSEITAVSASSGGIVTSNGGADVTARGCAGVLPLNRQ